MRVREQEQALVGAALLDESVARFLLSELAERDLSDPTSRLVLWALRRAYELPREILEEIERASEEWALEAAWSAVDGTELAEDRGAPEMTDLEMTIEALDCAGLLDAAGGEAAVAALVEDRPSLRAALTTARTSLQAMAPIDDEPLVAFAESLLGE
jgi:hypothetical protein